MTGLQTIARNRMPERGPAAQSTQLFFTKDNKLLSSYYKIREECYRAVENGPAAFEGREDHYDRLSDILVIVNNGHVIGGARIFGRAANSRISLPLEEDGFSMKRVFSRLDLNDMPYCEFGRMAILPEYRTLDLLQAMIDRLLKKSISRGYKYLFTMAPYVQSRCYRKIVGTLNFPYPYEIHKDIVMPRKSASECGVLKMYLSSLQFPDKINAWSENKNLSYNSLDEKAA